MPDQGLIKRALKVGNVRVGITCNNKDFIYDEAYFGRNAQRTLLSDFSSLDDITFGPDLDGYLHIIDSPNSPLEVSMNRNVLYVSGDLTGLEKSVSDLRFSVFGNLGLFSRFVMTLGEMKHDEFSYHSSVTYDERKNRLILAIGGAAAGKSCCILAGLNRGFKLFSTERAHFQIIDGKVVFYRGSTVDNVWNTNMYYDFPELMTKLNATNIPKPEGRFGIRVPVDMTSVICEKEIVIDPEVVLLFPVLQINDTPLNVKELPKDGKLKKLLFDNAGDKIGQTFMFYERLAVPALESSELAQKRLVFIEKFMETARITKALSIITGPKTCLDPID